SIQWIANTRPYKEVLRDYAPVRKHNLSVSGGSKKTSYYASLGVQDQEGFYKLNTDQSKRYNFLLNMDSEISNWFSLSYGIRYSNKSYAEPVNPGGKGGWWVALSQEYDRNVFMPIKTPEDSPGEGMYTDNIIGAMDYGSRQKEKKSSLLLSLAPEIQ